MTRDAAISLAPPRHRTAAARVDMAPAHGAGARSGDRLAGRLADVAMLATVAAIVALFALSPLTLEANGVAYMTSGGGVLSKVHPATLLAGLALGLRCLAARHPVQTAWRLATGDPGIVLLTTATTIAAGFAVAAAKVPVTPLIDTFVLPMMVFLLLKDLDGAILRGIALLLLVVFAANAIIGIAELLRHTRMIHFDVPDTASADPTRPDVVFDWRAQLAIDWRSSALFGHPLVNGMIVGSLILCLLMPEMDWLPALPRLLLLLLEAASMFSFGARASLVLTIAFGASVVVVRTVAAVSRGVRLPPRGIAIGLLAFAIVVGGGMALFASGFIDKTIDRFDSDAGSASTRLTMFTLFAQIPFGEMLLVPDKNVVATLQRMYGLEFGIESSWIGLLLTYGWVVTALIVAGLAAFARSVSKVCGRGAILALALYFILVSVSAAMNGKTTSFAMSVALAIVFLRKDGEGRHPAYIPTVGSVYHGHS